LLTNSACRRVVLSCIAESNKPTAVSSTLIEGLHQVVENQFLKIMGRAVRIAQLPLQTNRHGELVPKGMQLMGRHLLEAFRVWTEDNLPDAFDRFRTMATRYEPVLLEQTEQMPVEQLPK
jgi:hypothetical protein